MSEGQEDGAWKELNKSGFEEVINLEVGKYKSKCNNGFSLVFKDKKYG